MHRHCDSAVITAVLTDRCTMHRADACRLPGSSASRARRDLSASINAGVIGQASLGPRIITVKRVRRPDMRRKKKPSKFGDSGMTSDPETCAKDFLIDSLPSTTYLMSFRELVCHTTRFEMLGTIAKPHRGSCDETGTEVWRLYEVRKLCATQTR